MNKVTETLQKSYGNTFKGALNLPNGAQFYRCALQINPFNYLTEHGINTPFTTEDAYNQALIEKCIEKNIKVIAVTDHYKIHHSIKLLEYARKKKIKAFGGFEAVSKDGVHFLLLFNASTDNGREIERFIGECGVHNPTQASPIGELDSTELLEKSKEWGSVCIAAHIISKGGLLKKLTGQSRIKVWKHPNLLACALPGPVSQVPDSYLPILENRNPEYKRQNLPAFLNANDVNSPDDLDKDTTSCFIKMSEVSIEALRQAFLDPVSRIRLNSDPLPEQHPELTAITWDGGFLSDTRVRFNNNLNVLVGGRGSGKSTMLESIRYVLGLNPLCLDAKNNHEGIIRNVLKPGTKVSLMVSKFQPTLGEYIIERTVPNPPVVKDRNGEVLNLLPSEVMPGVEVFGQHEISELTKSPEKLTQLLGRFVENHHSNSNSKAKIRLELENSQYKIGQLLREKLALEDQLSTLPGLEETLSMYLKAGLEKSLEQKSLIIREENLFTSLEERLNQYREIQLNLPEVLPVDTAFVSEKALNGLPNAKILAEIKNILGKMSTKLGELNDTYKEILLEAENSLEEIKINWALNCKAIEEDYQNLLRDLQKSSIDGEEFIKLSKQVENLRPKKKMLENLSKTLKLAQKTRRNLLSEWEDLKSSEFRELSNAAKNVSKQLEGRVFVSVKMAGNQKPLFDLLRGLGGNLNAAIRRLEEREELSLQELAQRCREGTNALIANYNFPPGSAERIANAGQDFFMKIEELDLPPTTHIQLNTAPDGKPHQWQELQSLSTGQKATAVLLLLLLESEAPLIVDQPEDDLDNWFITEGVVPIIRKEKMRRQIVFSTHNANIPVLGDAEIIFGFSALGEAGNGQSRIAQEHMGSIDSKSVRKLVEDILEGGKAAFEMRRSKYGF